jgi:hypothetical protein
MGIRFRARKTVRFGPLYFNFTQRGFTSWGVRVGPVTRNFTRGTTTVDTPGPGSLHVGRSRRRRGR